MAANLSAFPTLQRELEAAVEEGFQVIDLVSADENVAVLERPLEP